MPTTPSSSSATADWYIISPSPLKDRAKRRRYEHHSIGIGVSALKSGIGIMVSSNRRAAAFRRLHNQTRRVCEETTMKEIGTELLKAAHWAVRALPDGNPAGRALLDVVVEFIAHLRATTADDERLRAENKQLRRLLKTGEP